MIVALFGILALTSIFLVLKNNQKAVSFLVLLLILSSTYLLLPIMSPVESAWPFLGGIGSILTLSFVLGSFIQNKWLKTIIAFVLISFIMLLGDSELAYGSYTLNLSHSKIIIIPLLGALIMAILDIKVYAISKMFPEIEMKTAERSVVFLVIGIFAIIATFLASWFGFFLLGIGAFIYNAFSTQKREYIPVALITISIVAYFIAQFGIEAIDLSIGKVIAGLLIGAGTVGIVSVAQMMNNKLISVLLVLASGGLITLVLLLNGIHPAYGGIEAFTASILGIAFAGLFYQNNYVGSFLLPLSVVIGLSLSNDPFENSEIKILNPVANSVSQKVEKENSIVDSQKGLLINQIKGDHTIEVSSSIISFQLGPKGGVTKGEIKGINGSVNIAENIENSSFNVKIPVIKLSTFNAMRDESLMEDLYFNEPKFPTMNYTSRSLLPKEDGYLLKGKFTMLGITNNQEVYLKYVGEKEGKKILVGEAILDKTKFGMDSSPQEGDIVSFTFQILLVK